MKKFTIIYTGDASVEVEANSEGEALEKFWEDGLNDLDNVEIIQVDAED